MTESTTGMPNLPQIYDENFFAEWGPANLPYVGTARLIAAELTARLRPARIADLGCGCGVYSHAFAQLGVQSLALDGVAAPPQHRFPVEIHRQDMTVPFKNIWGCFDFTLCLEVAEHIPPELSSIFLDNILQFSDTLVLSAAPPHQGGHHHVNEQPRRYWAKRLAAKGYAYNRPATGLLWEALLEKKPAYMWMAHQIAIYEKVLPGRHNRRTRPFAL